LGNLPTWRVVALVMMPNAPTIALFYRQADILRQRVEIDRATPAV
jgi:hypothetical protein